MPLQIPVTVITTEDLVLGDTIGTPLSACGGIANIPHKELAQNIEYLLGLTSNVSGSNLLSGSIVKRHLDSSHPTDTTSLAPLVSGGNGNTFHFHGIDIVTKTTSYSVSLADNQKTIINTGAVANLEFTLPANPEVGFRITVINNSSFGTEVVAPSGSNIITRNGMTAGYNRSMMIPSIGQKLDFLAITSTTWLTELYPNSVEENFPRGNASYVPLLAQTLGIPFYNNTNQLTTLPGPSGIDEGCFDGRNIWTVDGLNNRVIKTDTRNPSVSASVTVGILPDFVAFDGYYVWVSNNVAGTVSKIDTNTNQVVATVTVQANPDGVAFNGANEIWVVNFGSNSVSVINTITNTVTNTINLFAGFALNLTEICFDGSYFWVTCSGTNELKKINASTKTLETTVSLGVSGSAPEGICFDGQNIWATCQGTFGGLGHAIAKINAQTPTVSGFIQLPINYFPTGICFDGRNIWVGCQGPADGSINKVIKINPNTLTYETYDTGTNTRPKGMLFDGQFVWACLKNVNKLRRFIP